MAFYFTGILRRRKQGSERVLGEKTTLLIVSQRTEYTKEILHGINLAKAKKGFFAVIRPHQAENFDYKKLLKELELNGAIDRETPLIKQFEKAGIVIGIDSTALLEATLAGKPVIFCDGKGFPVGLESRIASIYACEKSLVHAENPGRLGKILDNPFPYFAKAQKYKTRKIGGLIIHV